VITHAGLNTALESLARGVPMVCVPVTGDQPAVAARVAWVGAGVVVPPARLTERRLRAAVCRVLHEPAFAASAARLRDAIARCGGVRHAADVIDRVLATGRPVPADAFGAPGAVAGRVP
jgi:UDP:flavonoid glycosyltransferase YjiC (YdhE family)